MTLTEVISKWEKKHKRPLNDVLNAIKSNDSIIVFPKALHRHLVTTQIFADLGYKLKKDKTPKKEREFYIYIRKDK